MKWGNGAASAFALLVGVEAAGHACARPSEDTWLAHATVVADGVATCDTESGVCNLQASRIIKDDEGLARGSRRYRFHFVPGAREDLRRRAADPNTIMIECAEPWESMLASTSGRFFLRRGARDRLYLFVVLAAAGAPPANQEQGR